MFFKQGLEEMQEYRTKAQVYAFERGIAACREGKSLEDNPYPPQADYFDFWKRGYFQQLEERTDCGRA
ncbi:hypothetical protein FMN50_11605 [Rhodobacterales bacterium]|nr:hypothetical protein FMN50_11605 [Rhodobacterales bacterium]